MISPASPSVSVSYHINTIGLLEGLKYALHFLVVKSSLAGLSALDFSFFQTSPWFLPSSPESFYPNGFIINGLYFIHLSSG